MFVICLCWSSSTHPSFHRGSIGGHTLLFLITGRYSRCHWLAPLRSVMCLLGIGLGLENWVSLLFLRRALGLRLCVVLYAFDVHRRWEIWSLFFFELTKRVWIRVWRLLQSFASIFLVSVPLGLKFVCDFLHGVKRICGGPVFKFWRVPMTIVRARTLIWKTIT